MFTDQSAVEKVAVYTRVSTEEQAERGFSLDAQMDKLKSFCETYNLEITEKYIDGGFSGRNTRRPEYQRMLKDHEKWDAILVLKIDRIHRNSKNFMEMMTFLYKHNKEFLSVTEKFDTSTAMGRFVMDMLQRIAQLESEQIGERIVIANVEKAKNTEKFMGHRIPFGYNWDPDNKTFIPIPKELNLVKKAFDLYINGTFDPIVETKNGWINKVTNKKVKIEYAIRLKTRYKKEGHSFRSIGNLLKISESTIKYYLNNVFYVGYERYTHFFRKINNGFKPIISIETWNKTQNKMRNNSRSHHYDPILIPDDQPTVFKLNPKEVKMIPTINRAKHNFNF